MDPESVVLSFYSRVTLSVKENLGLLRKAWDVMMGVFLRESRTLFMWALLMPWGELESGSGLETVLIYALFIEYN